MKHFALAFVLLFLGGAMAENIPEHVGIVLDCSGSMEGWKMKAAKEAIYTMLTKLPKSAHAGVYVFSAAHSKGRDSWSGWLVELEPLNAAKIRAELQPIEPRGNTPLARSIKAAADRLLQERGKRHGYGSYTLVVVTDGEENQNRNLIDVYPVEVMSRGITLHTIGVGMDKRHTLATKSNSYRDANDTEALAKALSEVAAEISAEQKDTAATQEAFAALAPLPDELAKAMVEALSSATANHPIGEKPKPKVKQPAQPTEQQAAQAQQAAQPASPPAKQEDIPTGVKVFIIAAVIVVIVAVILILKEWLSSL